MGEREKSELLRMLEKRYGTGSYQPPDDNKHSEVTFVPGGNIGHPAGYSPNGIPSEASAKQIQIALDQARRDAKENS